MKMMLIKKTSIKMTKIRLKRMKILIKTIITVMKIAAIVPIKILRITLMMKIHMEI